MDGLTFAHSGKALPQADEALCRRALTTLHRHYPGWSWTAEPAGDGSMIVIRNVDLGQSHKWGFCLMRDAFFAGNEDRVVMRAGGELLERYRRWSGGFREDSYDVRTAIFERPQT